MIAIGSSTVDMSWTPPSNSSCIDHYIVRVENGLNFTTNLTSVVIDELEEGITYSFSVRAVDLMGREGTISEAVLLTMDGMEYILLVT